MTASAIKEVLIWCVAINYGVLLAWFLTFACAHSWLYRMHSKWFKFSVETFDALHYVGMSIYKIGVILLNLVPLIAIYIST